MVNLSIRIFCFSLLLAGIPAMANAAAEEANPDPVYETRFANLNVKELTNAQIFKYGRELYRKGDYAQAVKVFQRMLKGDCENRLAQYHIQKIAQKGPQYQYLQDYLQNLPCEKYNFTDEDFLPASLYYETDNDLLLAQIVAYNKRYRDCKASLSARLTEYESSIKDMEQRLNELTETLQSNTQLSAETILDLKAQLSQLQSQSGDIQARVESAAGSGTDIQIAAHKDMIIADLKAQLASVKTGTVSVPAASKNALPVQANTAADTAVSMIAPNNDAADSMGSLQAKLARIQARLQQIEQALIERNQQLQAMANNLNATQQ